jgi:hypothetical protein
MAETFEVYRTRVLSYLGDEEPIGVQRATPSHSLSKYWRMLATNRFLFVFELGIQARFAYPRGLLKVLNTRLGKARRLGLLYPITALDRVSWTLPSVAFLGST